MKFTFDHDYHIHSKISLCSGDAEQTPERILEYAKKNGLKRVVLTDHYWDEGVDGASGWYEIQNYGHIAEVLPLPEAEGVEFLFGCETDLNKDMTLGVAKETFDKFGFVVIPTTHLHMRGWTISEEDASSNRRRAELWIERFDAVLNMDLPFHKIGIAHLTCGLLAPTREDFCEVASLIPDLEQIRLFTKAAEKGCGIELNYSDMQFKNIDPEIILRFYRIAKACGCKFYLGSDAHHPNELESARAVFERAIDLLGLTEDDKFILR